MPVHSTYAPLQEQFLLAEGIFSGFRYIRQQSQVAGAFDGVGQLTLVTGASPGLATRANLALFGYIGRSKSVAL